MTIDQKWFTATTQALAEWRRANEHYHAERFSARYDPEGADRANRRLRSARTAYREVVLGWYRKLLCPMRPGDAVPNEVAELLAEEWDTRTGWAP